MAPSPNWFVAIMFYLLFVAGILVFVVLPGLGADSLKNGPVASGPVWADHLCHIRPDQPGHPEGLARTDSTLDMLWGTALPVLVGCIGFVAGGQHI
jgi:uncharacterized membrane protein